MKDENAPKPNMAQRLMVMAEKLATRATDFPQSEDSWNGDASEVTARLAQAAVDIGTLARTADDLLCD